MMINKKYFLFILGFIFLLAFVWASSAYGEEIQREGYSISRSKVERTVALGTLFQDFITVENLGDQPISATFSALGNVVDLLEFDYSGIEIYPKNSSPMYFYIKGTKIGNYSGEISISGGITERIPVNIQVVDSDLGPVFFIQSAPFKKYFKLNENLKFKIYLNKLKSGEMNNLTIIYYLNDSNGESFFLGEETFNFTHSFYLVKEFNIPPQAQKGEYLLQAFAIYNGESIYSLSYFIIRKPFMNQVLFGFLPVWMLFLSVGIIVLFFLVFFLIRRHIKLSKKYRMELDVKKLPGITKENFVLGKIAETKIKACLEPDKLKTHTI
ncbi:MAG TPA: hypothetical protein VJ438_01220, partial [Candidatus Nanoarchaeia archaeon]|nr:hypothetical protein [Candidatus Nanoarchaeia archaeon]